MTDDAPASLLARLRRFAPALLIAALVGAAALVVPKLPRDHDVHIFLAEPARVTGVEIGWTQPSTSQGVQGASWNFELGAAPSAIDSKAHLAKGSYELDVIVTRPEGSATTRRVVTVDDSEPITVRVH